MILKMMEEKNQLISKILSRWWYYFPPWPPEDWDYEKLKEEFAGQQMEEVVGYPGIYHIG